MRLRRQSSLLALTALLATVAVGCGTQPSDKAGESDKSGPPDTPLKIRMGWGIPAEEIKA